MTLGLDNAFTYIDGSRDGVIYPNGASAFVNGTVRERRIHDDAVEGSESVAPPGSRL